MLITDLKKLVRGRVEKRWNIIDAVIKNFVNCRSKALKDVIGKTKKLIEEMGVSQREKAEAYGENAGKEKECSVEREKEGKTGDLKVEIK